MGEWIQDTNEGGINTFDIIEHNHLGYLFVHNQLVKETNHLVVFTLSPASIRNINNAFASYMSLRKYCDESETTKRSKYEPNLFNKPILGCSKTFPRQDITSFAPPTSCGLVI